MSEINENQKVSVIVTAYNAAKTIIFCLDSLMQLDFPSEDREIIVVNNNSTDNTKEIIGRYPVRYVFESKKTRGAARNKGISIARSKYIAFIDSDCIADKNWLKELIKGIEEDDNVVACGGDILAYKPETLLEKYAEHRDLLDQEKALNADRKQDIPRVVTANAIFQREILEKIGYFDEDLITSEDTEIGWRLVFNGYQMKYLPKAVVYHRYIKDLKSFCLHQFEYGCASQIVDLKYSKVFNRSSNEFKYFLEKIRVLWLFTVSLVETIGISDRQERIYSFLDELGAIFFTLGKLYQSFKRVRFSNRLVDKINSLNKKIYVNYNGYKLQLNNNVAWFLNNGSLRLLNLKDHSYYSFNDIATQTWLNWVNGRNLAEAVDEVSREYSVSKELVTKDIMEFIKQLSDENILVESRG